MFEMAPVALHFALPAMVIGPVVSVGVSRCGVRARKIIRKNGLFKPGGSVLLIYAFSSFNLWLHREQISRKTAAETIYRIRPTPVPGVVHHQHQAPERSASRPNSLEHRRSGRRRKDASTDGRSQHALADVSGEGRLVPAPASGDERHLPVH